MPRDAQPVPAPPQSVPRVSPRTSLIWIRIGGRWLPGHVQRWVRLPDGRWAMWAFYQADPEHPTVAPRWGHWLYDPEAVVDRERHPERPAG